MQPWLAALLLLFFSAPAYASLLITEIMYDPPVNESYDEWIEIYNPTNSTISLENWTLCNVSLLKGLVNQTDGKIYSNTTFDLSSGSFAVITDGGTGTLAYTHYDISGLALHTAASTLCGGLTNNNGTLYLSNVTHTASIYYNSSLGGANNNRTLCAYPESNSTLQECPPTPGSQNKKLPKFIVNFSTTFLENINYSLFNLSADSCENVEAVFQYNLTNATYSKSENFAQNISCSIMLASFYPLSAGILTLCWNLTTAYENQSACSQISILSSLPQCSVSARILTPIFANASQSFQYFIELNDTKCENKDHNVTIQYWIEDLFGIIVKEKINTTQEIKCYKSVSRDWTPPDLNGSQAYIIRTKVVNVTCNNMTEIETTASLAVKGAAQGSGSSISIVNHENSTKFGDVVLVELGIYRGNTTKYAIDLWTEKEGRKSSSVTTVHADEKYKTYKLKVPVQIKQNCDSSIKSGSHTIVVSGLDITVSSSLTVEGTTCPSQPSGGASSSSSSATAISSTSQQKENIISIDVLSYNETATAGADVKTTAIIKNLFDVRKNISVYSYVFRGSSLASEGGWVPNAVAISLNASKNMTLTLQNKIKEDISEGVYYLRIRAKSNKTYDKTVEIIISRSLLNGTVAVPTGAIDLTAQNTSLTVPQNVSENTTLNQTDNKTAAQTKKESPIQTTGMLTNLPSAIGNYVINFHILSLLENIMSRLKLF